jgi:hypothetical protein
MWWSPGADAGDADEAFSAECRALAGGAPSVLLVWMSVFDKTVPFPSSRIAV